MSSLIGQASGRWSLSRAIDALRDSARQAGRPGLVWIVGLLYPSVGIGLWWFSSLSWSSERDSDVATVRMQTENSDWSAFNPFVFMPADTSPERYTRYDAFIREAATLYQIPEPLVRAVIRVESDFDPRAVSPANARGLMQMIPETAERMLVSDVFDPRQNIFGGVRYLRVLANTFNGDLALTVAAYNAGEGAVIRHGGIPPYPETQEYVTKVVGYYRQYRTDAQTR